MLIQLQPTQISLLWAEVKHAIVQTNRVPNHLQEQFVTEALKGIYSGKHQVWLSFTDENGERKIHAVGVTTLLKDNFFNFNHLHIMSLYGFRTLTPELISEGIEALRKYAKNNDCVKITMSTNIERIEALAIEAGMTPDNRSYSIYV